MKTTVTLRTLGEQSVPFALAAIAAASSLGVDRASAIAEIEAVQRLGRWRMELSSTSSGALILNDAHDATPRSAAEALKTLAQVVRPGQRSIAILGDLGTAEIDENDRVGRLVVRLNVHYLVVVGAAARHIHNAAGLEGSWNGESVLVETAAEAYDLLRDELREGDVVLIKGASAAGLGPLGDRLAGFTG
jgi:UDP-N-acetylmuramoyl-tripeptide--D-alanyl-D-alanine ligase